MAVLALALLAAAPASLGEETERTDRAAPASTGRQPAALPVTVTIDRQDPGRPVPLRFLGLSFEVSALSQIGQLATRGDLVQMLRTLGPGMLRFGGITADQNVAWTDAATPRPAWATSVIGPAQMRQIGMLARLSGWKVLLTVGLAHYDPSAAAREVAAAHRALGPYLAAVEIGNEPNAYGRHGFREMPWLAQGYEEQVSAYREAIGALTPGVAIAGPDISGSGVFGEWGYAEALSQRPAMLTGHHYPLGCAQTPRPTIETLLSAATRGREAQSLATYLSVSQAHSIPLRVDEAGSVSCGGVPGISDTFASALWATGYITQAMAAGVAGINLEGNPTNCAGYTPLCAPSPAALAAGRVRAQPAWDSLLLTRSLVGFRPLPSTIEAATTPNLAASAFAGPGRVVKLALVDDELPGARPLAVTVGVGPGLRAATVRRLSAPSPWSTTGLQLSGPAMLPAGSRRGARAQSEPVRAGALMLSLSPSSAELVTIVPRGAIGPRVRRHG